MNNIIRTGRDLIERGEDFVLAKVMETVGSAPRKRNAWMIMDRNQLFYGTVGGGKLEAEVQKCCKKIWENQGSEVFEFSLTPAEKQGIDMQCGGDVSVSVEYIDHRTAKDFGAGLSEKQKVYIFGGGHVGKEVEKVLSYIGFETFVLDDRQEFADENRFSRNVQVKVLEDFGNPFEGLDSDENTYIVIVTRGHGYDYEVLKAALKEKFAYVGMIGSKRKNKTIFDKLRGDGVSEALLEHVHAPIGISIGAETPEEIAVSIAAEIIQVKSENEQ